MGCAAGRRLVTASSGKRLSGRRPPHTPRCATSTTLDYVSMGNHHRRVLTCTAGVLEHQLGLGAHRQLAAERTCAAHFEGERRGESGSLPAGWISSPQRSMTWSSNRCREAWWWALLRSSAVGFPADNPRGTATNSRRTQHAANIRLGSWIWTNRSCRAAKFTKSVASDHCRLNLRAACQTGGLLCGTYAG